MPTEPPSSTPVVWITGASGGLGRGLLSVFASQGWRVAGTCCRNNISDPPEQTAVFSMDLTRKDDIVATRDAILARWGQIDVLINNAGIARDRLLGKMTEEEFDEVLTVNLKGAFLCSQAVFESMSARGGGHIIHIASYAGRQGAAGQANYSAAKAGLLGMAAAMAREGGPYNIRVNSVLPGVLPTAMTKDLPEEVRQRLISANTLQRMNAIDEVARFVFHLAGMQNVSGQVFQLDSRIAPWT